MSSREVVGLNVKWHRYQKKITQEVLAEKTNFKISYVSLIERGEANPTCNNIDIIANALNVDPCDLFNKQTAMQAKKLPLRVDQYMTQK